MKVSYICNRCSTSELDKPQRSSFWPAIPGASVLYGKLRIRPKPENNRIRFLQGSNSVEVDGQLKKMFKTISKNYERYKLIQSFMAPVTKASNLKLAKIILISIFKINYISYISNFPFLSDFKMSNFKMFSSLVYAFFRFCTF